MEDDLGKQEPPSKSTPVPGVTAQPCDTPPEQLSSAAPSSSHTEIPFDPTVAKAVFATWMEDQQLSFYVLVCLTAGVIYLTYLIFRPFLTALFFALIIAIVCYPLYKWLLRPLRSSYVAALCTTVIAVVVILVPLCLMGVRFAAEATNIYSSALQPLGNPARWPARFTPVLEKASDLTGIPADKLRSDIAVKARQMASWSFSVVMSLGRRFFQQVMTVGLAFVFLFPLLRNSDEFRAGALSMLPLSRQRAKELASAVSQGIIADIYGVVAVGVVEGMLIACGFWMTGLRSPLVWGIVASILSCLPFVGVALVWVPGCIVLAFRGNWTGVVVLLVWCAIVVSIVEGSVRSAVVGGRARVNSMLVMLSIMGGIVVFGGVGIFVGPVVLVLLGTLVRILREEHATAQDSPARS